MYSESELTMSAGEGVSVAASAGAELELKGNREGGDAKIEG